MRNRTKEELKQLRKKLGLSVKDCCEMTGTSKSTWERWEIPSTTRNPQPLAHKWLESQVVINKLEKALSEASEALIRMADEIRILLEEK